MLKLRRLEGLIAVGLGDLRRGESLLIEVRESFAARGLRAHAAMFGLDLAGLYLQQGRDEEATALVRELLAEFRALDYGREFTVAVLLLEEVQRKGQLSIAVLDVLRRSMLLWLRERPEAAAS